MLHGMPNQILATVNYLPRHRAELMQVPLVVSGALSLVQAYGQFG
jgi:hypothetical protein